MSAVRLQGGLEMITFWRDVRTETNSELAAYRDWTITLRPRTVADAEQIVLEEESDWQIRHREGEIEILVPADSSGESYGNPDEVAKVAMQVCEIAWSIMDPGFGYLDPDES